MKHDRILGQLVALTKAIQLRQLRDRESYIVQFMINNAIGMTWWDTARSHKLYQTIAKMAIQLDPRFAEDDVDEFVCIMQHTLQSSVVNPHVFHFDKVLVHPAENLFEARAIADVSEFARCLWALISVRFQQSIHRWLTLYPLPKVEVVPWHLGYDGISLVDFAQAATWPATAADFGSARDWNPILGTGFPEKHVLTFFYGLTSPPAQWLVCESQGTSTGARLNAEQKMRRFLAVLFSHMHSGTHSILQTSMVPAPSVAVQFPESSIQQHISEKSSNIGILLPSLLNQVRVNNGMLSDVRRWYENFHTQQGEKKERANKGALFVNYAIVASGLERFIMFFVGLDALHGQRGKVEESIKAGVQQTFPHDPRCVEKAEQLFDLRSDIVHGGSARIKDWRGLEHYLRYFQCEPEDDIEFLSMVCLRDYWKVN